MYIFPLVFCISLCPHPLGYIKVLSFFGIQEKSFNILSKLSRFSQGTLRHSVVGAQAWWDCFDETRKSKKCWYRCRFGLCFCHSPLVLSCILFRKPKIRTSSHPQIPYNTPFLVFTKITFSDQHEKNSVQYYLENAPLIFPLNE